MKTISWRQKELVFLVLYAIVFYTIVIHRSLQFSHDYYLKLRGLRPGWIAGRLNDVSDAQWRNFRGNLSILTVVFGIFTLVANLLRTSFVLKAQGMSFVWLLMSLAYLTYLHGACIIFIVAIALANFLLVKIFGRTKYFSFMIWGFNLSFLVCNRIYEGYQFSSFGLAYVGIAWVIWITFGVLSDGRSASILIVAVVLCEINLFCNYYTVAVVLRMISFGYDYHWADQNNRFDQKKHIQRCASCSSGKICYLLLQERSVKDDKFSFPIYLCYLVYAPLYIAGPIISFNAFASQLEAPQNIYSSREVAYYGCRWVFCLLLMEVMSHFFYYNAFAISGVWRNLTPMDIFIIGYGVLNFMWLKFLLTWRYFRFWALVNGIVAPENMPKCINNCHTLESFWKNWHASFNKWLVRYVYIPLGGAQKKLLNVWVIFTFVAVWHDLEWKLLSWAWLTCIFFIPEMLVKSAANAFQVQGDFGGFIFRELSAAAGAVTIICLMVANLVGFVIGPSGLNWLVSRFAEEQGLTTIGCLLFSFYVGTKLMFHISDAQQTKNQRPT